MSSASARIGGIGACGTPRGIASLRSAARRRMLVIGGTLAMVTLAPGTRCARAAAANGTSVEQGAGVSPLASARVFHADPSNYLALLRTLGPGDTLLLAPGVYDDPAAPPGLPIFGLHGAPGAPITITGPEAGPRPVFLGRATHNTIRIADASHVVVRNLDVDGVIERNAIRDTLGYNLQVKHQAPWTEQAGLPEGRSVTIIRDNVFSKAADASTGTQARPNMLVGDVPPLGRGAGNGYEIYRYAFLQNPTESLLQAEGNVAVYANAFVNDAGAAISVQPHNGRVRDVLVLGNTIVAAGHGASIRGGDPAHAQRVVGNAVFASPPLAGGAALANVTGGPADAARHLADPLPSAGERDFRPRPGALRGSAVDARAFAGLSDRDRDLDGRPRDWTIRGAYGAGPGGGPASPGPGPKP